MYGTGYESSLARLDAGLPPVGAFLICLEPLKQTLADFLLRPAEAPDRAIGAPASPAQRHVVSVLIRIACEVALALAFLEQHSVVVRLLFGRRSNASLTYLRLLC